MSQANIVKERYVLNLISEERKNHRSQFSHAFPHNFYLFHLVRLWGDVMQ